jgi:uncharacterized protein (DUF488 family)
MVSTLYTIGFTKKTAEEFFGLLRNGGVRKVVDVRENRTGQLQGFARFPDIEYFLQQIVGASYEHQPLFAPSPEIRDAYRATRDWPEYERSFSELMQQREVLHQVRPEDYEGAVALLCSEDGPEKCHRRLVAEMLARCWNDMGHQIEVRHLTSHKSPVKKRRARKADD